MQALSFLISSRWLIEEAAEQRSTFPTKQLARALEERMEATPGGSDQFKAALAAAGQTVADVRFELKTRWAASVLERRTAALADGLARAQVTDAAIGTYYRTHVARYRHRETRYYDLIERIKTRAAARAIARRFGSGEPFARAAVKEHPPRPEKFNAPRGEGEVLRAVFSAKIGTVVGPLKLRSQYCLFVLRRIEPASLQPLAEVRRSIAQHLFTRHRRNVLARLTSVYNRKWTARTDCARGYVVQKCRQYDGTKMLEGDPFADY